MKSVSPVGEGGGVLMMQNVPLALDDLRRPDCNLVPTKIIYADTNYFGTLSERYSVPFLAAESTYLSTARLHHTS